MRAKTTVDVDVEDELVDELIEREPDKSPAEIVNSALRHYANAHRPWIALDEADNYEGGR